jgi:hypothetical protein
LQLGQKVILDLIGKIRVLLGWWIAWSPFGMFVLVQKGVLFVSLFFLGPSIVTFSDFSFEVQPASSAAW